MPSTGTLTRLVTRQPLSTTTTTAVKPLIGRVCSHSTVTTSTIRSTSRHRPHCSHRLHSKKSHKTAFASSSSSVPRWIPSLSSISTSPSSTSASLLSLSSSIQRRRYRSSPTHHNHNQHSNPVIDSSTMTTESKDTTPHLDAPRPLQALYERLSSIQNINEVLNDPRGNEQIKAALSLMDQVTLEELGLSMDYFLDLSYGQSMTIVETPLFDIAAFILPKGFILPLHDHPNMIVCSKLLLGQVKIRSFSSISINEQGDIKAHLEIDTNKSYQDSSWMLTPNEGNYHEICPMADCVMLDILLPPYHDHDRPCKFYHAKKVDMIAMDQSQSHSTSSNNYVLRPLPVHFMQRVRLPHNVPYVGYRPSETS